MYKLSTDNNVVQFLGDGFTLSIPFDEKNADYQRYLEWLAEGNTPEPPDPESTPDPPNWEEFNVAFLTEQNWLTVADLLLQDLRYGIVSTAANGNSEGLQSAVNIAKSYLQSVGQPLTDDVRQIWQAIADANSIPVTF